MFTLSSKPIQFHTVYRLRRAHMLNQLVRQMVPPSWRHRYIFQSNLDHLFFSNRKPCTFMSRAPYAINKLYCCKLVLKDKWNKLESSTSILPIAQLLYCIHHIQMWLVLSLQLKYAIKCSREHTSWAIEHKFSYCSDVLHWCASTCTSIRANLIVGLMCAPQQGCRTQLYQLFQTISQLYSQLDLEHCHTPNILDLTTISLKLEIWDTVKFL